MDRVVQDQIQFIPSTEAEADEFGRINIDGSDLSHISSPPPQSSRTFSIENITRKEVLDYGDGCFLLNSVLTQNECEHFIQEGERVGFESISHSRDNYRSSQR